MTIVVAGEALIDLVLAPDGGVAAHPGGGPFNVARTAARLGAPVAFLGRLSSDRFGRVLSDRLAGDGVRLDRTVATADPTTLALAEIDADGAASYRFYVEGTSAPGLEAADVRGAAILCVGTLGLVLEPMAHTLERAVADADASALVMVDPNCRPDVIADEPGYRARLARVLARADVVKLSDEDLAWLAPGEDPLDAAAALGPGVALVTRGGDGAVVVTPSERRSVSAPPVRVADTIGAGDAFAGGFLAWWHERGLARGDLAETDTVAAAAAFACLVAARTCERPGAEPPQRAEV